MNDSDLLHLKAAIAVSARARANGNHPFGAILVAADGATIAEAENTVVTDRDPTGHAETNLVRLAGKLVDPKAMSACTLYSSCEPCAMCSAAIFWSGIGRVVYALPNGALMAMQPPGEGSALALSCAAVLAAGNHPVTVEGPALVEEAAIPHDGFWV